MSVAESPYLATLKQFLLSIQKPGKSLENITVEDSLVTSGLIDSLAIIQIVLYLEQTYNIDFAIIGFDAERLSSISGIVNLIEETR
jgi:acyl carrier protein